MSGILVSQSLHRLVEEGAIQSLRPLQPRQIQPSSIDLRLGARVWQLPCSFFPGHAGIERKLGRLATATYRTDRDEPLVLHRGAVYLAEIEEVLELPEHVWGRANPKSSTGRLDVFVRVLTETGFAFDTVPAAIEAPTEITPRRSGATALSQLRLGGGRPGPRSKSPGAAQKDPLYVVGWFTGAHHGCASPGTARSTSPRSTSSPWAIWPGATSLRSTCVGVTSTSRATGPRCRSSSTRATCSSPSSSTSSPPGNGCGSRRTSAQSWWRLTPPRESCARTMGLHRLGQPVRGYRARREAGIEFTHDVPFLLDNGQPCSGWICARGRSRRLRAGQPLKAKQARPSSSGEPERMRVYRDGPIRQGTVAGRARSRRPHVRRRRGRVVQRGRPRPAHADDLIHGRGDTPRASCACSPSIPVHSGDCARAPIPWGRGASWPRVLPARFRRRPRRGDATGRRARSLPGRRPRRPTQGQPVITGFLKGNSSRCHRTSRAGRGPRWPPDICRSPGSGGRDRGTGDVRGAAWHRRPRACTAARDGRGAPDAGTRVRCPAQELPWRRAQHRRGHAA